MKKLFILCLTIYLWPSSGFAQKGIEQIPYYDNINFSGQFEKLMEQDASNQYFILDMSKLIDDFEKKYFEDLVFKTQGLVRLDAGNTQMIWVKVSKQEESVQHDFFNNLLNTVKQASASMDQQQRGLWLSNYNK
jgi:hypothetical protein